MRPTGQGSPVLFYVQHLLGIGHLMRAGRIAMALQENGSDVTLVTGGLPVSGFELPGVRQVNLPPIAVSNGNFAELVDADGKLVDDEYRARRCEQLLQVFRQLQPECVIIEAFPFGRRQVRFELLPLIEAIEATEPKPILLSSLRDILQKRLKPERDEETARMIRQHFDKVLVHGDPNFATLDESFSCAKQIADKLVYTGLVCAPRPQPSKEHFDVVVSAGGGAVGARLVHASLDAALKLSQKYSWCIIAGPNMPDDEYAAIASQKTGNITLQRFRPDFPALLCSARLSISQAGYNTVGDILQAKCRSILVPYSASGETEQTDRAVRLQEMGLAQPISENSLSGASLATQVEKLLLQDSPVTSSTLDTQGAVQTAEIVQALISDRHQP
ncbi:UDP-N-acetylglucosamine--N-acetylmuramyl-(pentapeptide) pyrophosphoryl-undecaprenol N-acetylglucosamine transferase [Granulosicoccus antarcticus IMCC3135]|uniref:UDP-N-acetylglucosamine--N-acetylmuramyl-(Pentapeptide) pyrophosphoryl-undecaprenol N-acetylglucosamine transferase n=1 Tax=Granulosicoccus antarcticus IMCC3135 TaxID=1192854 RepID=A0A2Z2P7Y5_9GAMM|nr:UDP-N-acetylglucosamine--N-acetylmuramyl-(pentapeptide) pyrophosphoryl-undecaprenol N-acetylglucosamine transferase [Granulosicoccus antarcticus IMCC3135]